MWVNEICKTKGISFQTLSELSGIHSTKLELIWYKRLNPSVKEKTAIAKVLNCPISNIRWR